MTGVDQHHIEPVVLQDLVHRDPVDSRRLHGHAFYVAPLQPPRQGVQLGSKAAKRSDRLRIAVGADRDV